MLNLTISTIVFFVAAWFLNRYLDEQGIPKGMTRTMLVFTLAAMLSWGSGELADWTQVTAEGPRAEARTPEDLSQLLKTAGQLQR